MLILLPEAAGAKTIVQQLTALDPETRMEQRCNGRVSGIIRREHKEFNPDEVVAYAFADSTVNGSEVVAPGAAFRSHGNWYRVSYHCRATPDGLGIQSFDYRLGPKVPRQDWDKHYLVP
jgi:hypothetical protein